MQGHSMATAGSHSFSNSDAANVHSDMLLLLTGFFFLVQGHSMATPGSE